MTTDCTYLQHSHQDIWWLKLVNKQSINALAKLAARCDVRGSSISSGSNHALLQFEVAVQDALLVQVVEAEEDGGGVEARAVLGEGVGVR